MQNRNKLEIKFKCWFNDLTNVTFHNSPNIAIAKHIDLNNLHTTQII
jgi:hypothetical protein